MPVIGAVSLVLFGLIPKEKYFDFSKRSEPIDLGADLPHQTGIDDVQVAIAPYA